ncbi:MAG: hypothetical protein Q7S84_04765 [bacterium]|nr:hypothetical protein [bacterium]
MGYRGDVSVLSNEVLEIRELGITNGSRELLLIKPKNDWSRECAMKTFHVILATVVDLKTDYIIDVTELEGMHPGIVESINLFVTDMDKLGARTVLIINKHAPSRSSRERFLLAGIFMGKTFSNEDDVCTYLAAA